MPPLAPSIITEGPRRYSRCFAAKPRARVPQRQAGNTADCYLVYYMGPRAFRSGALEIIKRPVNGWPNSKIRKIAHAADRANSERLVNTVTFKDENRLK